MFSLATLSALLTSTLSTTGFFLIFIVSILDATAFVGFLVPGQSFVMLLGGLIQAGVLTWWKIVAVISLGAIVGDVMSYLAGKYITTRHVSIKSTWQERIVKARQLLDRGLISALFLDRFILPWRPIVPFVAGSVGVSPLRVLVPAAVMNVVFAITFTSIGYAIAAGISFSTALFNTPTLTYALLFIFILLLTFSARHVARYAFSEVGDLREPALIYRLLFSGIKQIERFRMKWPRVHKMYERVKNIGGFTIGLSLAIVYLLVLIVDTSLDVMYGFDPEVLTVDIAVHTFLADHLVAPVVTMFTFVTQLGSTFAVTIFSAITILVMLQHKLPRYIPPFLFTTAGAIATTHILKILIARPRPEVSQIVEQTYSYPSGHATAAFAFYGFLFYLVWRTHLQWKYKVYLSHALFGLILVISFSRLYLGVHYLSDVLVGAAIGTSFLLLSILLFKDTRK